MKKLYLVRHAKSSWKYPDLMDIERPLNKRGKRDLPRIGSHLKEMGVYPDLLISSPANRAFTTAKGIAEKLGIHGRDIGIDRDLYHANSRKIASIVENIDDQYGSLMLFGHNPGFTDFAEELTGAELYNVPTCGVVIINLPIKSWQDLKMGAGELEAFIYPKGI